MNIKQGALALYYCYDVSDEIKLGDVETILGQKPQVSKLTSERIPSYVQYRVAPLLVKIGEQELPIGGKKIKVVVEAKLHHFGVITIRFWAPLNGPLKQIGALVAKLAATPTLEKAAREQLKRVLVEIQGAMVNSHKPKFWEDYIMVYADRFERPISGLELLKKNRNELASILCCDVSKLSESEINETLQNPLSYYDDELVLIDWNAAFIYNPRVSYDVADVIEFALISSLELRMYDHVLDDALARSYDDITLAEKRFLRLSPFAKTIKFLTETKLEVSEMIDKIEHALKIVGDIYLAKVYTTAAERFWLEKWKHSVKDKLATMESIYKMLYDRTNSRLMTILETLIVLLFVADLVLLAVGL